jgi:hypothetical protein
MIALHLLHQQLILAYSMRIRKENKNKKVEEMSFSAFFSYSIRIECAKTYC